jgi:hypothetical protein
MRAVLAVAFLPFLFAQALAQTPSPSENGRYQMTPSPNGFLRLDTRSGAVSVCVLQGVNVECRAAADDRAALAEEVERLSRRNAELEARGATVLPSRDDMGKAMDYAEEFMQRMKRVLADEPKTGN